MILLGAYDLLSDAHQGEDASQTEENRRDPGGKEGRQDSWFSEGEEEIKSDPIGKSNHHADSDAQSDSPWPACLEGERDTDQDHDQI